MGELVDAKGPGVGPYDIGIIGGICSFDLTLAEHLSRRGFRCSVAVRPGELDRRTVLPSAGFHRSWSTQDAATYSSPRELLAWTGRCRAIISLTGSIAFSLRELWPLRRVLRLPPIVNFTTGSDMMELAAARTVRGAWYRDHVRTAALNWCVSYPRALENIIRIRAPRVVFLGFPYELPALDAPVAQEPPRAGPLKFFHPAHLDFGIRDQGALRASTKGNDRFIRAFARAVHEGLDAHCIILDRGPDREEARRIVAELGTERYFTWEPHLSRTELASRYVAADVVVDQFDVGGIGAIAAEAMSHERPVIMYIHVPSARVQYDEPPPVLNCATEDQIFEVLLRWRDRGALHDVGRRSRAWIAKHHGAMSVDRLAFYWSTLTGEMTTRAHDVTIDLSGPH